MTQLGWRAQIASLMGLGVGAGWQLGSFSMWSFILKEASSGSCTWWSQGSKRRRGEAARP